MLSDTDFLQQLDNCTLTPAKFDHKAHVRLAWIQIQKYGLKQAKINIEKQILSYVDHLGARDKYNHTLTLVAVGIVHHFIEKSQSTHFEPFIEEYPELIHDFKNLVSRHYSFDIFNSDKAKREYIKPDRSPVM